jgi:hypothetical protein
MGRRKLFGATRGRIGQHLGANWNELYAESKAPAGLDLAAARRASPVIIWEEEGERRFVEGKGDAAAQAWKQEGRRSRRPGNPLQRHGKKQFSRPILGVFRCSSVDDDADATSIHPWHFFVIIKKKAGFSRPVRPRLPATKIPGLARRAAGGGGACRQAPRGLRRVGDSAPTRTV